MAEVKRTNLISLFIAKLLFYMLNRLIDLDNLDDLPINVNCFG